MSDSERGQVTASAAEIYDSFFVPALFQEWAGRVTTLSLWRPSRGRSGPANARRVKVRSRPHSGPPRRERRS